MHVCVCQGSENGRNSFRVRIHSLSDKDVEEEEGPSQSPVWQQITAEINKRPGFGDEVGLESQLKGEVSHHHLYYSLGFGMLLC